ncbi:metallophosphoesterase [Pseudarthrobacter sp. J75]|uniref:metallophosphoesterase n=1 Tax=unclassified Pseudarthrobacter TaxID=2647000 RepID=UPI002E817F8F|nr:MULTISPECIES: metallophosphoesterase [unclassified Pseudarthrobacter]MEE2522292.1 metallophosphoesterase [Pseudarthrobacter sp. J47]MEE2528062.1 metallophosphoesterase [Pseudarthrobacter sp. J75]
MADASAFAARARSLGRGVAGTAGVGAAVGLAAFGYGLWEKNQFVLREESLAILPEGQQPFRILHLSDIHFVPGQQAKAEWLKSLAELEPDLVVNTGDNLSHPGAIDPLLGALAPLLKFPGVFVPGSNDYFAPSLKNPAAYLLGPSKARQDPKKLDWPRLRSAFGNAGWVDLTNRHQSIPLNGMRFDFSGVDDPHLKREQYAGWPRGTKGQDSKPHLRVAVIHAPYQRVLDHFTEDGADLLLAGHTHGGQLCIPGYGALVTNCDLPTWRARGLHDWDSNGSTTPVNVSGGIGTSRFAPIRIACRPEAVLLTLTSPN